MPDNRATTARELYARNVAQRKARPSALLSSSDPVPDSIEHMQLLHPSEIAVFGITPELHPALAEAWLWYAGAIAGTLQAVGYDDFIEEERRQHPSFAHTFDQEQCALFMHQAAGLPLRQCIAWTLKIAAAELRDRETSRCADGS